MADLRISELTALAGANLASGDLLPIVDISASETKKITVVDLVGNATTLIADATIPGAKILFGAGSIAANAIEVNGLTSSNLATGAVTAAKLANESTVDLVTTLPASGAFVGQLALDTDDNKVYCWNGSSWLSFKAAGSVNTIVGDTSGIVNLSIATSGDQVTITTSLDNTTGAAEFLAGPTNAGGAVTYRPIVGGDLPTATTSTKGAVQVNGNGLTLAGNTLSIDNTVTANTAAYHLTQYTAKGLVTDGRAITGADLPIATSSTVGVIKPDSDLTVSGLGVLSHTNAVAAGTATKVTFDAQGHITAGTSLVANDIPELPASKITSGTLAVSLLGTNSITGAKLSNSSTVQFGGAGSTSGVVTFPAAEFKGQYFWDELNGDLYLWSGSSWLPVTITSGELVFSGTYNASTNLVASVTSAGSAAGYTVGAALPAANDTNNRHYLVVSVAGTGTGNAPNEALAPPDMILSNGATYDLIDVSGAIAGQTATNISFTPYGSIAATNVQTALQELDDEKLPKAGGTVTGELLIGTAGSLVFEGSTANAYETTLAVTDPTADRTVTFADVSGTVITTGDTATVTSTMLAGSIADSKLDTISTANKVSLAALDIDGGTDIGAALADADLFIVDDGGAGTNRKTAVSRITDYTFGKVSGDITIASDGTASIGSAVIVNADISASAEIAVSKLADGAAYQLLQTDAAGTGVEWTNNVDIPGTLDVTGAAVFDSTVGIVGAVTINDAGADVDVRMEGDTNTHLFFLDASTDRIGINQSTPATKLDVSGSYAGNATAVSALDIDCSAGNYFTKTINGASTFTVSNVPASRNYAFTLELEHTSGAITWFSTAEWPGGTAPTLTTGKTHLFIFQTDNGGTRWRASSLINYTT